MSWVLIILMYGDAVAMHDFNSESACTAAVHVVQKATNYKPKVFCVPKG
jgi:hypothetical protein